MRTVRFVGVAIAALVTAATASSALGGSTETVQAPQRIAVTASEYKFALKPKTARKGVVVFTADEPRHHRARLQDQGQEDARHRCRQARNGPGDLRPGRALPLPLHIAESRSRGHERRADRPLAPFDTSVQRVG